MDSVRIKANLVTYFYRTAFEAVQDFCIDCGSSEWFGSMWFNMKAKLYCEDDPSYSYIIINLLRFLAI